MNFLDGYKTYLAGIGLILLGTGEILVEGSKLFSDGALGDISPGVAHFMAGLAIVGFRRAMTTEISPVHK